MMQLPRKDADAHRRKVIIKLIDDEKTSYCPNSK
jgi:hypothetical protein